MNRRWLIALAGLLALQRFASAQQAGRVYRLGMMTANDRADWARNDPYRVAFMLLRTRDQHENRAGAGTDDSAFASVAR